MICPHCEELREEIRFLKRQLGVEQRERQLDRLKRHFRIPVGDTLILAALANANGRILSQDHLDNLVPHLSAGDDRDPKHVAIRICRLRKILGSEAIEHHRGRGYFLTNLGRLQVEEALEAKTARAA